MLYNKNVSEAVLSKKQDGGSGGFVKMRIVHVICFEKSEIMRKCFCMFAALSMMLLPVLWGCAAQEAGGMETTKGETPAVESTSQQQEAVCVEPTESPDSLKLASDEELIDMMINGRAIEAWAVNSAFATQSAEGIDFLAEKCPEFKELLLRDSGLQSLKEYGLQIAEEYRHDDESRHQLNGHYMLWLLDYLFPDLEIDFTE